MAKVQILVQRNQLVSSIKILPTDLIFFFYICVLQLATPDQNVF